jgi:hypothetical protein
MTDIQPLDGILRQEESRALCEELRALYTDHQETLDRLDRIAGHSGSPEVYKLMMEIFSP